MTTMQVIVLEVHHVHPVRLGISIKIYVLEIQFLRHAKQIILVSLVFATERALMGLERVKRLIMPVPDIVRHPLQLVIAQECVKHLILPIPDIAVVHVLMDQGHAKLITQVSRAIVQA